MAKAPSTRDLTIHYMATKAAARTPSLTFLFPGISMLFSVRMFLILLLWPALATSKPAVSEIDADIARYLTVTRFVPAFKWGITSAIKSSGRSNARMDQALALPDAAIIAEIVPIFREVLTPEEARQLADFYSSDTGKLITQRQMASMGQANPQIDLTVAHRVEYMQFSLSAGGRATKRLDAMQHTDAYWERKIRQ
jgi:hypothetical protein